MNKSYSKVKHIKTANLLLEKRYLIKESNPTLGNTTQGYIMTPNGDTINIPNVQILKTISQHNVKMDWNLPEDGGKGNKYTAAWIPKKWSDVFTKNKDATFSFKTPDNKIWEANFSNKVINNILNSKLSENEKWNRFYKITPDISTWTFVNYTEKGTNNVFKSTENTPKNNEYKTAFDEIVNILFKARDISWENGIKKTIFNTESSIKDLSLAILAWVRKNKEYDSNLLKGATTLIFRESKSSPGIYLQPKEILGLLSNIFFFGDHSQGYAQIQPEVAEQYGINMVSVYTYGGSFDALYKILKSNYNIAKKYYNGDTVTIYKDNKLTSIPAVGGDAALHMALAAHNAGSGVLGEWCQTNIPNIANRCNKDTRKPWDDDRIAVTDKSKKIPNYFPKKGTVYSYMPQIEKCFNSLVYLPERVKIAKSE